MSTRRSVIAFDSAEGLFVVKYADGDQEDVKLDEIQLQFPADPPEHQVAWRCPIHTIIRHCDAAT